MSRTDLFIVEYENLNIENADSIISFLSKKGMLLRANMVRIVNAQGPTRGGFAGRSNQLYTPRAMIDSFMSISILDLVQNNLTRGLLIFVVPQLVQNTILHVDGCAFDVMHGKFSEFSLRKAFIDSKFQTRGNNPPPGHKCTNFAFGITNIPMFVYNPTVNDAMSNKGPAQPIERAISSIGASVAQRLNLSQMMAGNEAKTAITPMVNGVVSRPSQDHRMAGAPINRDEYRLYVPGQNVQTNAQPNFQGQPVPSTSQMQGGFVPQSFSAAALVGQPQNNPGPSAGQSQDWANEFTN
jgi:hypothetical protein